MGAYAGKARKTMVDNATIRLNSKGQLSAGGIMEPTLFRSSTLTAMSCPLVTAFRGSRR
jgi:hypothetical protein